MKAKPQIATRLPELLAACAVLPIVLFVFTHNQVYNSVLTTSNFFSNFTYQAPILLAFFVGLLALLTIGNEKVVTGTYILLWILLLPSILWFSNLDWFKILGFPFNLKMLTPNLPFNEVLVAGLVLVTSRIFLSFMSQIKNTRQELHERGASEPDAEKAVKKQTAFFSMLVLTCIGAAFLIVAVTSTLKIALQGWFSQVQYAYIILGSAGAATLIVCTALYLRSQAGIKKEDAANLNKSSEQSRS